MPDAVTLTICDIVRDALPSDRYDVVYDSGCFHHLAPHRRETYRRRVLDGLSLGGRFGIVTFGNVTFDDGSMESTRDAEIIASGDVGGGIGFTTWPGFSTRSRSSRDVRCARAATAPSVSRSFEPFCSGGARG